MEHDIPMGVMARQWLGRLTRLNPAQGRGSCRGKAPHKPLLLLALLDMAEAGEVLSRVFHRSAGLALRFRSYSALVADRWPTRLDLRMPFFHLSTQGFWRALDSSMNAAGSPEGCTVCELDEGFFGLLGDAEFRSNARMVLIAQYFDAVERVALYESFGMVVEPELEVKSEQVLSEAVNAARRKGRSAQFAIRVVAEYRYTCALTGYRCMTTEGASIVDAAHIEAWSATQNDDVANGLALSKSAHWMFDEGLWSVDEDWRVVVNAGRFEEHGLESIRLSSFRGQRLRFDPAAKLRPSLDLLRKHRLHFACR